MKQTSERLMPAFFILGLLVLWEGAVRIFGIPLYVLPSPVQVAETLVQELPVLALHARVTVAEALAGVAISLVLALALGVLMDCFPMIRQGLYPVLVVTQTVPMIVHLYGLRRCSQDPDSGFNVLVPGGGELFRWTEPGGCGICASGPVLRGRTMENLLSGEDPGGSAGASFGT